MTMTTSRSGASSRTSNGDQIRATLASAERMLDESADRLFDAAFFEALGDKLRRLHALTRIQHAAGVLEENDSDFAGLAPEHADQRDRLLIEHGTMLGMLDRIIRATDHLADKTLEDKEVNFLRIRELIAVLRRHEAEEDRLFYLAVWRDTGGES